MKKELLKIIHSAGGLLMLTGAALQFFELGFSKYIFAIGAFILISMQAIYVFRTKDDDFRLQRINRLMFIITLLLGVAVYLMFTGRNLWVILVLIYALVSIFLSYRSGNEMK